MEILLKVSGVNGSIWEDEFFRRIQSEDIRIIENVPNYEKGSQVRGPMVPVEVVIALASAPAITTFYQVISKLLEKNKGREITIQRGKIKLTIKDHPFIEEKEFIAKFAPELLGTKPK